jgi:hypothetical protein
MSFFCSLQIGFLDDVYLLCKEAVSKQALNQAQLGIILYEFSDWFPNGWDMPAGRP